jgi:hypothetical protein
MKTMATYMKKQWIYLLALSMVITLACSPDEFPEIGDPIDRIAQMGGTWRLNAVTQQDNDAIRKGFPEFATSADLTNRFPYTDLRLTLALDERGNPSTFTVSPGLSPNVVGLSNGTWDLDDRRFPSKLIFRSGGTVSELEIASLRDLDHGAFLLRLTRLESRGADRIPFLTYRYRFTKS